MTDEFLEVATKEINEDLRGLEHLLALCKNDRDVFSSSSLKFFNSSGEYSFVLKTVYATARKKLLVATGQYPFI